MSSFHYKIAQKTQVGRLDIILTQSGIDLSRRKIRKLIDVGGVYINGTRVRMASKPVKIGDLVSVEYSAESFKIDKNQNYTLSDEEILYDANDIIAINKPPGLNVHPTRSQAIAHATACVETWLKNQSRPKKHLQLVHRLDKETSGILLFALTHEKATFLMDQFRERKIEKYYEAICFGAPKSQNFSVKCLLSGIDKNRGTVRIVDSDGKHSETVFELIAVNQKDGISLIGCYPLTGRSHQLRVHLASKGLPIMGDKKYDPHPRSHISDALKKLIQGHHMLHAKRISFQAVPNVPDKVTIEASAPKSFIKIRKTLVSIN
ncbi:MAG: RluA family pseudouridine synthase [Oligoflexales bacterium]|nr:RluA family pseudouridine synthase [Oligoflexales bacterium]